MNKKRALMITAALVAVLIVTGAVVAAFQPLGKRLSGEDKTRITERFESYMYSRGFSGAVYAVYHGREIFDEGSGQATDRIKNGSDVAYGVASITKQFTAAAIMQLYQDGKLSLDDTLDKYFPDYRFGSRITLSQLLCQRSGIPDYMVDTAGDIVVVSCYNGGDKYTTIDPGKSAEENIKRIRDFFLSRDLLFEPGSRFDYSDSNYALLAEIISQVSGMSYHQYIREHIFKPLKMEHSAFIDDYDSEEIPKVAETDRYEFSMDYYSVAGAEYGCGDILTTPKDLYRWYKALTHGKVVKKELYEQMIENYSPEEQEGYGYGLMMSDTSDSKTIFHYGYIPSYYSTILFIPEYDYFQVVLSNHATGYPHRMASDMAKYFGTVIDLKLTDIE